MPRCKWRTSTARANAPAARGCIRASALFLVAEKLGFGFAFTTAMISRIAMNPARVFGVVGFDLRATFVGDSAIAARVWTVPPLRTVQRESWVIAELHRVLPEHLP
jgi:hypothetical protein